MGAFGEVAQAKYDALVAASEHALVTLDFDGTLAHIVDNPAEARLHPAAPDILTALASRVAAVAIITGRPAREVLALGGLEELGERFTAVGRELYVFGQYGHESWSSTNPHIMGPRPPAGLASFLSELPGVLRSVDAADAHIEHKGIAVAVHTRRMTDPQAAFDRLLPALHVLAHQYHLHVEPGRLVIEVRPGGMHKGLVVDQLMDRFAPEALLVVGDDIGDVEAFASADAWALLGCSTFKLCSLLDEDTVLTEQADAVVEGPDGVVEFLRRLTMDISNNGTRSRDVIRDFSL